MVQTPTEADYTCPVCSGFEDYQRILIFTALTQEQRERLYA